MIVLVAFNVWTIYSFYFQKGTLSKIIENSKGYRSSLTRARRYKR